MTETHTHQCQDCGMRFPCDGSRYWNEDGDPETCCRAYHDAGWNECGECLSKGRVCHVCEGTGELEVERDVTPSEASGGLSVATGMICCPTCAGTGTAPREDDVTDGR